MDIEPAEGSKDFTLILDPGALEPRDVWNEIFGWCPEYAPAMRAVSWAWRKWIDPKLFGRTDAPASVLFVLGNRRLPWSTLLAALGHLDLLVWHFAAVGLLRANLDEMLIAAAGAGQIPAMELAASWGAADSSRLTLRRPPGQRGLDAYSPPLSQGASETIICLQDYEDRPPADSTFGGSAVTISSFGSGMSVRELKGGPLTVPNPCLEAQEVLNRALRAAVAGGHRPAIRKLVSWGALPKEIGKTAPIPHGDLMALASRGDVETLEFLVRHWGTDISVSWDVAKAAAMNGHLNVMAFVRSQKLDTPPAPGQLKDITAVAAGNGQFRALEYVATWGSPLCGPGLGEALEYYARLLREATWGSQPAMMRHIWGLVKRLPDLRSFSSHGWTIRIPLPILVLAGGWSEKMPAPSLKLLRSWAEADPEFAMVFAADCQRILAGDPGSAPGNVEWVPGLPPVRLCSSCGYLLEESAPDWLDICEKCRRVSC